MATYGITWVDSDNNSIAHTSYCWETVPEAKAIGKLGPEGADKAGFTWDGLSNENGIPAYAIIDTLDEDEIDRIAVEQNGTQ